MMRTSLAILLSALFMQALSSPGVAAAQGWDDLLREPRDRTATQRPTPTADRADRQRGFALPRETDDEGGRNDARREEPYSRQSDPSEASLSRDALGARMQRRGDSLGITRQVPTRGPSGF